MIDLQKVEQKEFEKAFLENNIWPSIHESVRNRYLIISGAIAYYLAVFRYPEINNVSLIATVALIGMTLMGSSPNVGALQDSASRNRLLL